MKYKAVIFDMDGTILDTLEDLTDSVNYALNLHGYPQRTIEEIRSFVGNGLKNLLTCSLPKGSKEEVILQVLADMKAHYAVHCQDKTRPYEGILDVLRALKEQGIKTAVVSNKADSAVQVLCRQYFDNLFDVAIGEREQIARKPAPDSVFEALEELQVAKEEAVYIGDSEVDVKTAQNAELPMITVTWGFRGEEFLREQGAATFAHTMEELLGLLNT